MLPVRALLLPIALIFVLSSSNVWAQQPADAFTDPAGLTPAQVQQLFDAMIVMQVQDALGLTEQKYIQLLPRVRVLQDTRRKCQQEHTKLFTELQRLTNPKAKQTATDADLKQRLVAWQELDSRCAAEIAKAYNGIDELLDVRQQAQFRVFEEQIERRKLELVALARRDRQQLNRQKLQTSPKPPGR